MVTHLGNFGKNGLLLYLTSGHTVFVSKHKFSKGAEWHF